MDLKIEKAKEENWEEILELLQETGLKAYMTGKENHKSFYIAEEFKTRKLVGCFAIDSKDTSGILKSFAIKKDFQRKGVGKAITSKILALAREIGLKQLYASSWESPGFWAKTKFKEINENETNDKYFLEYVNYLEENFSQYTPQRKHFLLFINS